MIHHTIISLYALIDGTGGAHLSLEIVSYHIVGSGGLISYWQMANWWRGRPHVSLPASVPSSSQAWLSNTLGLG